MRHWIAVIAACLALATAPSSAQTTDKSKTWEYEGVTVAQLGGWCALPAKQDIAGGGSVDVLEVRPCGAQFPMLTLARAPGELAMLDAGVVLRAAMAGSRTQEVRSFVLRKTRAQWGECEERSYVVHDSVVGGVTGYVLRAEFGCPAAPNSTVFIVNFVTFVNAVDHSLFTVAFDSPMRAMTDSDFAMIREFTEAIRHSQQPKSET